MQVGERQSEVMARMAEAAETRRPALPHRHSSRYSVRSVVSAIAPDADLASPRPMHPVPERPCARFDEPVLVRKQPKKFTLWQRFELWSHRVLCGD